MHLFVTCARGLETIVAAEAKHLLASRGISANVTESFAGCSVSLPSLPQFSPRSQSIDSDILHILALLNYQLRAASRVLLPLGRFPSRNKHQLYSAAKERIKWLPYFQSNPSSSYAPLRTLSVSASIRDNPNFAHSGFVAQLIKDAVCDQIREQHNDQRPDVDREFPDVSISVHIEREEAEIYLDTSGHSPLFQRGYRSHTVAAPLKENLAAGLLLYLGSQALDPSQVLSTPSSASSSSSSSSPSSSPPSAPLPALSLVDPTCGSGTFLTESFFIRTGYSSQLFRNKPFAFEMFPGFNKTQFLDWRTKWDNEVEAQLPTRLSNASFTGIEVESEAFDSARANLQAIGVKWTADTKSSGKLILRGSYMGEKYGKESSGQFTLIRSDFRDFLPVDSYRSSERTPSSASSVPLAAPVSLPFPNPNVIVSNPPHGIRMGAIAQAFVEDGRTSSSRASTPAAWQSVDTATAEEREQLKSLYKSLGDFCKKTSVAPARAGILSGDLELGKCIGLKPSRKREINNGGIDSRWIELDLRK